MAKDKTKKADTKGNDKKSTKDKDEPETFKYGVADLADKLDLEPASVRVKLRNAGVEKAGKSYGWNTKAELDEVLEELKGDGDSKKSSKDKGGKGKKASSKKSKDADEDEDDDEDEKPSKKSKSSKTKRGSSKKSKKDDDDEDDD